MITTNYWENETDETEEMDWDLIEQKGWENKQKKPFEIIVDQDNYVFNQITKSNN